jgi:hypothetical protein
MFRRKTVSLAALVQAKIVRDANRAVAETGGQIENSRFGRHLFRDRPDMPGDDARA